MHLRAERPDDRAAVHAAHLAAFGDHGGVVLDLLGLLDAAAPGPADLSLVAEEDGAVVGHVRFSPGLLDAPARLVEVAVLSPLAVLPGRQGRGTGSALVRRGLEVLAGRPVPAVFLEGPPDYYRRLGFRAAGPLGFRRPSLRIPEPAFQVALLPSYAPAMTGTLVYADAFWRADAVGLREPG